MKSESTPIKVIDRKSRHSVDNLDELNVAGQLLPTDFYIVGAESWTAVPGGIAHPDRPIVNVDHHADLPSMRRRVSSTNLALERLGAGLMPDPASDAVVVNHMDCDSVLASGVLSGLLAPDPDYGVAAIAADHTGADNPVADLLQGLDAHWSRNGRPAVSSQELEYFFDCLDRFERGAPLDQFAQDALSKRQESRTHAERLVANGCFVTEEGVCFGVLDEPLEGELLLPVLSDALLVATANRHRQHPERWQIKLRLGLAAAEGHSLKALRVEEFDPAYGGRWNAGSNNRGHGTDLPPEHYQRCLVDAVRREWLS